MNKTMNKYSNIGPGHDHDSELMETAMHFINRGSSVVFLRPKSVEPLSGKHIKDIESAEKVFKAYPNANIAVAVGSENNLVAIRLDQETPHDPDPLQLLSGLEEVYGKLPATMTINYPDGSQCRLFEYPHGNQTNISRLEPGIKLLHSNNYGTGLVVLEPSILPSGAVKCHNFITKISKLPDQWVNYVCTDLNECLNSHAMSEKVLSSDEPKDKLEQISSEESIEVETPHDSIELMLKISPEEHLNVSITKMVNENAEPKAAFANAKMICSKHGIIIDDTKLAYEVFEHYRNVGAGGRYDMIGSEEALARFICDVEFDVFKDDTQMLRCRIKDTGEIVSLNSNTKPGNKAVDLITRKYFLMTNKVPKQQTLKDALRVLESNARYSTGEVKLYNRIGRHQGSVYYDIGDNTAIRITENGWEQVIAPAVFKRNPNIKTQNIPIKGGNIEKFFEYVNCEPQDKLLLATYMVSTLIPDINHPIPYIYGDHGSAKSSLAAKIKQVCDPSPDGCLKLTLNNQKKEIVRNLSQYHVVVYDNLSNISEEISDVFCMASTGGGVDIRKLYSDDDSNIMTFRCCPILNSVKMCIKKPDLLDRAILFRLKRLKKHKSEDNINTKFKAALPGILGGMFDTLSKAMAIYPNVQIDENFRMADFAKWGYAIAEAMGSKGKQFLSDYRENYQTRNEHVAQGNTLCDAVLGLMANRTKYEAEIGFAYTSLKKQSGADKLESTFPSSSRELRPYLEELGPVLSSFGITFEFGRRTNKGWPVKFTKFTEVNTGIVEAEEITE